MNEKDLEDRVMKLIYNTAVKINELNKVEDLASYVTTATIIEPEKKWAVESRDNRQDVKIAEIPSKNCGRARRVVLMNNDDLNILILPALKHTLRRTTFYHSLIIRVIERNIKNIRQDIKRELVRQIKLNNYDPFNQWQEVLNKLNETN